MKERQARRGAWRTAAAALLAAAAVTALAALGVLDEPDLALADRLYQRPQLRSGQIVLVQIDQKAIQALGPYEQWDRTVMADVLDALSREDCRPAVIGLDVIYGGQSDPAQDAALAQAAARCGNVVAAAAADMGTAMVPDGRGDYQLRQNAVLNYEQPYEALAQAADVGCINSMLDSDGVLRHHLLRLTLADGGEAPSFALAVAQRYAQAAGLGELALPRTDAAGFWYLPFSAVPGDFSENISVADVLSGAVDPAYFRDKIVLIGPYAPGFQDSQRTAIDHAAPMYGLEVQANAVEALLRGTYPAEAPAAVQLLALFVLCAAVFFACWRRPVKLAAGVTALVCAGWLALCRGLYGAGYILRPLYVPAAAALFVLCLGANYVRTALENRRVTNTFRRYVAPEIVRELLREGPQALELGGRLTDIAVLFVDVRGFTAMSERLAPERVVEILNRYLTLISQCIRDQGGTLDKFVGDAAMAFWGAPLPQADYVQRAARAALAMAAGAEELARQMEEQFGQRISFGIGIHAGPAVVGNTGAPWRMDYTAIGDTVNTAARLEANAPGGTIYISRAVADALGDGASVRSLGGTVKLKGKAEGFEVLILDALREDEERKEGIPT